MIRGETMLTHQAAGAHDLDDSAGDMTYNYGSKGIDSGAYDKLLANEKENFGVLISKVWEFIVCLFALVGIRSLITLPTSTDTVKV